LHQILFEFFKIIPQALNISYFFENCLIIFPVKIIDSVFVNYINRCLFFEKFFCLIIFKFLWIWNWTLNKILFYFILFGIAWSYCIILRKDILRFFFLVFLKYDILLANWTRSRTAHYRVFKWIFCFLLLFFIFYIFLNSILLSLKKFFPSMFHKKFLFYSLIFLCLGISNFLQFSFVLFHENLSLLFLALYVSGKEIVGIL